MKLLFCPYCDDIFKLISKHTRTCACGAVAGRYEPDEGHAVTNGKGMCVAIANPDLQYAEQKLAKTETIVPLRCWARPHSGLHNKRTSVQRDLS